MIAGNSARSPKNATPAAARDTLCSDNSSLIRRTVASQPSAPLLVPSPLTRSTLLNRPVGGCPKSGGFIRSQA
jgi:hypothetical protein